MLSNPFHKSQKQNNNYWNPTSNPWNTQMHVKHSHTSPCYQMQQCREHFLSFNYGQDQTHKIVKHVLTQTLFVRSPFLQHNQLGTSIHPEWWKKTALGCKSHKILNGISWLCNWFAPHSAPMKWQNSTDDQGEKYGVIIGSHIAWAACKCAFRDTSNSMKHHNASLEP